MIRKKGISSKHHDCPLYFHLHPGHLTPFTHSTTIPLPTHLSHDPLPRTHLNRLATYRAPEAASVKRLRRDDALQAVPADGVGARQELGGALPSLVVGAQAGAAREETLVEVVVVDRDGLHQGGAHHRWRGKTQRGE